MLYCDHQSSKYFSVRVDATPDSSHVEQAVFILRYVSLHESSYQIHEHFLKFVDCDGKTGAETAQLIVHFLKSHNISLSDCRGQGYDNGGNIRQIQWCSSTDVA